MRSRHQILSTLLPGLLLLVSGVAACAVRSSDSPPTLGMAQPEDLPPTFSTTGTAAHDDRWWVAFHDPMLDRLVETALCGNLSLRAALERVVRAGALARRAGAPLVPQLDLTTGADGVYTRREFGDSLSSDTAEALSFGALASYEVDLWGRLRATRDASVLDARASRADLDAARVTIGASVGTTWYRLVEEAQIGALLDEQIATNTKLQILLEDRFASGKTGAPDVLRQQQLVERTRGDRTLSASRYAVLAHLLATLQGRPATDPPPPPPPSLIALPALPRTGVPAEALQRRPDVEAAWWRVHAADRTLAASIARCYPRLDLSASAILGGAGFEVLFIDRIASIAADLMQPVIDGGERRALVEADTARKRELLHAYTDTVLVALQEVEDALVQEAKEREHLESLERQHELARRVVETLLTRYGQGASAYLDVLAAIQSEQSLALSIVSSKRRLITYRIDLCRALAGPWRPACTPREAPARPACPPLEGGSDE